jgi:hypothetical protein
LRLFPEEGQLLKPLLEHNVFVFKFLNFLKTILEQKVVLEKKKKKTVFVQIGKVMSKNVLISPIL